jgi:hypothetical protein
MPVKVRPSVRVESTVVFELPEKAARVLLRMSDYGGVGKLYSDNITKTISEDDIDSTLSEIRSQLGPVVKHIDSINHAAGQANDGPETY